MSSLPPRGSGASSLQPAARGPLDPHIVGLLSRADFLTTDGQPTATAGRASLTAIARGAGIDKTLDVRTEAELSRAYDRILGEDGPFVVCVKVEKGRAEGRFDRDVVAYHRRFKEALAAR